jgi:1,4-alpha-glucan branching enzyme
MYARGRRKGTVRFTFGPRKPVRRVCVAGDFNNWVPMTMRKQTDGTYVRVLPVPSGAHEYKYIVDGQWVVDPDHGVWAMNCYGTMNSVMEVP